MTETSNSQNKVIEILSPILAPLGYEIVYAEIQLGRTKTLRLFIDFLTPPSDDRNIGIEDCVKVSRTLDEPLENSTEIDAIFKGAYELEVSSPGVDRPLRQAKDYEKFSGRDVRIHVFRPLTAAELENADYQTKNPKQKNFLGKLLGLRNEKVLLEISSGDGNVAKAKKNKPGEGAAASVSIPLPLIAKANIEPKFSTSDEI